MSGQWLVFLKSDRIPSDPMTALRVGALPISQVRPEAGELQPCAWGHPGGQGPAAWLGPTSDSWAALPPTHKDTQWLRGRDLE